LKFIRFHFTQTGLQIQTVQKLDAMKIEKFKEVALNDPGAVIKTLKNIHLGGSISYGV
jgi:hypothetical protein